MKLGILHFTDSHIKSATDWILSEFSSLVASVKTIYEECDRIYIVFTGDVVYSGSEEEYILASKFLNSIRSLLKTLYKDKVYEQIIFTPGNHDCNFNMDRQARKNAIKNMNYDYIGDDNSVIEQCLIVQEPFWNFESSINGQETKPCIYKEYIDDIQKEVVIFHSFNTAWMSSINENVGSLFYPIKNIEETINTKATINISVFHHHSSWLNPNTEENNKHEFSELINSFSDVVIYGHEHERQGMIHTDLNTHKECYIFAGEALQMNQAKKVHSGFQVFIINTENRIGFNYPFHWNGTIYSQQEEQKFSLKEIGHNNLDFHSNQAFLSSLNDMKLPLFFNDDKKIKLKDIFIYPDIEKTNDLKKELYENYVDSSIFIGSSNYKVVLLEGENQSGKSSLINMMYLDSILHQKFPLLINGKCFKKMEIDKPLEKAFIEQYENKSFEEYSQYSNECKILFIDNLNSAELNNKSILELLKKLENRFSRIIITTSSIYNIISVLESTTKDVFCGKILPLGHKKRNKLIENYHRLNEENPYSITEQIFLEKTKDSYEQVQTFLGDKLIPSYPIFVLSILQSMNLVKPNNYEQTSYGYCYQSLIHFALAAKAKIKNEDIDTYINYLSELAFSLFDKKKKSLSDIEFQEFHKNYSANYIAPSFTEVRDKLLGSGLLVYDEDEWFHFGYNYIFYFLVAQKIATILTEEKGRKIIQYLCKNIQVDKYANILIFVAHHSKDSFLIDETILASMIPFDDIEPITLERNGSFNELIKDIIQEFKDDIIRSNTDPIQEREKSLESRDKLELQMKDNTYEEDYQNMPSEIISFYQAVRSLEIVGQIIKNRKGSISKQKLHEMIKELYLTAFRTIGFLGKIVKSTKEELTISIQSKVEKADSKSEIAERINLFFQLMSFNFCLGIFSKVINSVGNRDLKPIFDDVANELNTPAAKLISFSIKTCYGKLSIPELKLLYKEFENNPVALRILKARVKSYLYNNYVKYDERQRIASTLKMSLIQPRGNNLISRT